MIFNTTLQGYCLLIDNPIMIPEPDNKQDWLNKPLRVIEFDSTGGALILNPNGENLALVDKEYIKSSIKCKFMGDVIMPEDISEVDAIVYYNKVHSRKGGYNDTLRKMVIAASLHSGKFNDNFLWQKT